MAGVEKQSLWEALIDRRSEQGRSALPVLQAKGWDEALLKFKPKSRWSSASVTTVGEFIRAVEEASTGNPKTIRDYGRAFRKIVADYFEIDGGKSKFDYRSGGRDAWALKVRPNQVTRSHPREGSKVESGFLKEGGNQPC